MKCNKNNPCSGKYGNCLDLKITNICNGKCSFCIEKDGYKPVKSINYKEIVKKIIKQNPDSLLILGGEPLLYQDLFNLISKIPEKIKIYITTNASLFSEELAEKISPFIKAINLSIHHYDLKKNKQITDVEINEKKLKKAIDKFGSEKVRINCNLVKGFIDSTNEMKEMLSFCSDLNIKKIRFAELQNCQELFVDSRTVFKNLPEEPFENGCEIKNPDFEENRRMLKVLNIERPEITVRMTCGLVNSLRPKVTNISNRNPRTKILYSDGFVSDYWINPKEKNKDNLLNSISRSDLLVNNSEALSDIVSMHGHRSYISDSMSCHDSPRYSSDSCHSSSSGCH